MEQVLCVGRDHCHLVYQKPRRQYGVPWCCCFPCPLSFLCKYVVYHLWVRLFIMLAPFRAASLYQLLRSSLPVVRS